MKKKKGFWVMFIVYNLLEFMGFMCLGLWCLIIEVGGFMVMWVLSNMEMCDVSFRDLT